MKNTIYFSDLQAYLEQKYGLSSEEASRFLLLLFKYLVQHVLSGAVVSIVNFAKFSLKRLKARPKVRSITGDTIDIPEKISIACRFSDSFK